ncbi:hypothetical protein LINPERPRIM_LOCUS20287, partial [Linum perenne]
MCLLASTKSLVRISAATDVYSELNIPLNDAVSFKPHTFCETTSFQRR